MQRAARRTTKRYSYLHFPYPTLNTHQKHNPLSAKKKFKTNNLPDIQETLTKHEKDGTTSSPEYEAAVQVFYEKHLCRVLPFPQDLVDSFAQLQEDSTVYNTMYHFPSLTSLPLPLSMSSNAKTGTAHQNSSSQAR